MNLSLHSSPTLLARALRTSNVRRNCAGRKKRSKDVAGAATSTRQNGASSAALPADLTMALPPEQSKLSAGAQPFLPDGVAGAGAGASAPAPAADHVYGAAAPPANGSEAAGAGSRGRSEPGGAAQAEAAPRASDAAPAAQLLAGRAPASAFEAPASGGTSRKADPGSARAAPAPDSGPPVGSAAAAHGSFDKGGGGVSAGDSDSLAAPLLPAGARDASDRAGAGGGGGDDKRAPWAATVAALLSLSLGWGLWLMPADFARLGWLPAIGVTVFLAVSTTYSGFLISRLCRAVPNAVIFGDIGEAALGRRGRAISYATIYATDATRCIILHLAATQALQAAVAREDVPLLVYALVIAGLALIFVQVPHPVPTLRLYLPYPAPHASCLGLFFC